MARRVGTSSAGRGELADPTLVPFANSADPMQRQARQQEQMFDQFQQVMSMIVQRFGDKHRDEMRVVREEIPQIRQLSGELQSLHSRLSGQPDEPPPISNPESPPVSSPGLLPSTESGLSDPMPAPPRPEGLPPLPPGRPIEGGASAVSHEDLHGHIRRGWRPLSENRGVTGRGSWT